MSYGNFAVTFWLLFEFIYYRFVFFGKGWTVQTPQKSRNEEEGVEEEEESDGAFLVRKQMPFFENKSYFEFKFKLVCVFASGFISM